MATLQTLRKRKFATVKAFADALGVSPSTASAWLRGDYRFWTPTQPTIWQMATLLEISLPAYYQALTETEREERQKQRKKAKRQ